MKNISKNELKTFRLHLLYSAVDGIANGALILNEFIFIKSLKGSNVQLAFLFQFSMVVFLFAMLANEIMRRFKHRTKFLRVVGIVTRLPLFCFAFFPEASADGLPIHFHYLFLAVFLLFYTSKIAITPSINQYLKGNYHHDNFGRLFGYSTTLSKIFIMISTFATGLVLDLDPNAYRIFYPIVGLLGIFAVFQLTKIPFHHTPSENPPRLLHSVGNSFQRIFHILKSNVPFRHLELGFIIYGFAWMSTHAVITIFYEKALNLNYSSVAFYNNAFNLVAIFLLPLFGKLIGKRDPRQFAILTFGSLMLFIFFTGLTQYYPIHSTFYNIKIYWILIIATFFNGVFMGSMPILWGIGSSYFCKPKEAADYQSVHLFLTGLRALVAPIIGIKIYEYFGFSFTYGTGIILLFVAIGLMIYSKRKLPKV